MFGLLTTLTSLLSVALGGSTPIGGVAVTVAVLTIFKLSISDCFTIYCFVTVVDCPGSSTVSGKSIAPPNISSNNLIFVKVLLPVFVTLNV